MIIIQYNNTQYSAMKSVGFIYTIKCRDISIQKYFICSNKTNKINKTDEETQHKYNCDNGHLFICNDNSYNSYNNHNNNMYKFIRENGGWDNWKFTIIEEFYCGEEMKRKEHYHFNKDL